MNNIKKQLLTAPYTIWMIGFIILPLFMIVYYAFVDVDFNFTFNNLISIFNKININALLLSLKLGILCTLICLILAYPLAMILSRFNLSDSNIVVFIFMLPMWMNFLIH